MLLPHFRAAPFRIKFQPKYKICRTFLIFSTSSETPQSDIGRKRYRQNTNRRPIKLQTPKPIETFDIFLRKSSVFSANQSQKIATFFYQENDTNPKRSRSHHVLYASFLVTVGKITRSSCSSSPEKLTSMPRRSNGTGTKCFVYP